MGKVVPFKSRSEDLNELLNRAKILRNFAVDNGDEILKNFGAVERLFEGKISEVLIDSRLISGVLFLCGTYISKILQGFVSSSPQSWYAIDHVEMAAKKGNVFYIKYGADMCFLLCSLFEARTNHRMMSRKAYIEIGGGLYYSFFSETKIDIGCHMAENFETMADVTREAVVRMKA